MATPDRDEVCKLLDAVRGSVTTVSATQRRHGNRLEEIQQALDLQSGRLDRIEDTARQILDVLRGRPDEPR